LILKGLVAKKNWLAVNRQSESNSDSDSLNFFADKSFSSLKGIYFALPSARLHHYSLGRV
jgi:hypothetical protein